MARKKKDSILEFLMAVIVIVVLFAGVLYVGKFFSEKNETENNYNGFEFYYEETSKLWFTQIQLGRTPYTIPFYHHPKDLEDIVVEENVEDIILKKIPANIIIAVPGDSSAQIALAGIEISKITGERFQVFNIPTTSAVNEEVEGLPLATCANANERTVIISFERSNKNLITSKGRCIILEFKEEDPIRVADAFTYSLIKIM
ncbi:hypothetical protein HQ533_02610 [Candidatus Woesearchaeota archaeon]|nr:hypothetical protein [Candidatus Woesearchaeota archaeon]